MLTQSWSWRSCLWVSLSSHPFPPPSSSFKDHCPGWTTLQIDEKREEKDPPLAPCQNTHTHTSSSFPKAPDMCSRYWRHISKRQFSDPSSLWSPGTIPGPLESIGYGDQESSKEALTNLGDRQKNKNSPKKRSTAESQDTTCQKPRAWGTPF